jgi:heme exporter protein B
VSFAADSITILQKDLRIEWRRKERLTPMVFFVLLVLLVFNFSFELGGPSVRNIGAGVLWSAFVFASLLGLNRTFAVERHNDTMDALRLAPVSGASLFAGKVAGNFLFLAAVELIGLPIFALFFNLAPGLYLLPLGVVLFLGSICLAAVGTFFAAVSDQSRLQDLMLPLLVIPVVVPALISCVEATDLVLAQSGLAMGTFKWVPGLWRHMQMLVVYAVVFMTISLMLFDYVIEE